MCLRLSEFLNKSDEYVYKMADNLLDALTNGEHSRTLQETETVSTRAVSSTFSEHDTTPVRCCDAGLCRRSR